MPLTEFFKKANSAPTGTGDASLPPGTVHVDWKGGITVWVHETPPQVWNLKWIANNSPRPYGGAKYRDVAISLPYIVIVAVFEKAPDGSHVLAANNECFFRTAPLTSCEKDELLVPGLLNCSLFGPVGGKKIAVNGHSVVWICSQYLMPQLHELHAAPESRMRGSFDMLYSTLMSTGYNFSSDEHEYSSGFKESTGVLLDHCKKTLGQKSQHTDPRKAAIDAWVNMTAKDPDVGLKVPWHRTGCTVREVIDRIYSHHSCAREKDIDTADDIARIVMNNPARVRPRRRRGLQI